MSDRITQPEITQWLTRHLAALLDIPVDTVDPSAPVETFGVSSMEAVMITGDLEARYGVALPATVMSEYATVEALAAHIAELAAGTPVDTTATARIPEKRNAFAGLLDTVENSADNRALGDIDR